MEEVVYPMSIYLAVAAPCIVPFYLNENFQRRIYNICFASTTGMSFEFHETLWYSISQGGGAFARSSPVGKKLGNK